MNRLIILTVLLLTPFILLAQAEDVGPLKVSKAVAYAKSQPLSELAAVLSPNKADAKVEDQEVKNELDYVKWPDTDLTKPTENAQTEMGTRQSMGPIVGFNGQGGTGFFPPDTDGDVSDEHFVQVVNSKYNVYDKVGNKLIGPLDLSTLWSSLPGPWVGTNNGDPIVLWDEEAERWIITQFSLPNSTENFELFAVSETSDPLGAYHLYAFAFGVQFNDYPKIGVWRDGYYATYNLFSNNVNPNFLGSKITVVEREKMLVGDPDASMIEFFKSGYYSTMPADIDGEMLPEEGERCPIMYITNSKTIQLWGFLADWEEPDNSSLNLMKTLVPTNFTEYSPRIPQPNDQDLDALGQMIMNRLAYRKFDTHASMVTNHTVFANGRAGVRWYEMRKEDGGEWTLHQEGTYAPDSDVYRWMGSIAMNGNGDIALAYSVSNNTDVHPSIRYTGRLADDPLGVMTIEEVEIKTGTSSQSNYSRWGDYACMNVDPANDTVFWFTTEYNGWETWIASFDLGDVGAATADAGEDAFICTNEQFETQGSGTGVLQIQWTTDGDGIFSPNDEFNTTYIRGNGDVANGGCTLTMTVTGFDGGEVSDDMYLNIVPYVNAGEDGAVNPGDSYQLQAEGTESGTIEWSTDGDGSFSDPFILQPIYTPGDQDIASGQVNLELTVGITEPCVDEKSDQMTLNILVGIDELENKQELSIFPNPSKDYFTINVNDLVVNKEFTYIVYNSYGQEVFRELVIPTSSSYEKTIDMSAFKTGVYFISLATESNTQTKKLIKE
jgi:hypothetical protein